MGAGGRRRRPPQAVGDGAAGPATDSRRAAGPATPLRPQPQPPEPPPPPAQPPVRGRSPNGSRRRPKVNGSQRARPAAIGCCPPRRPPRRTDRPRTPAVDGTHPSRRCRSRPPSRRAAGIRPRRMPRTPDGPHRPPPTLATPPAQPPPPPPSPTEPVAAAPPRPRRTPGCERSARRRTAGLRTAGASAGRPDRRRPVVAAARSELVSYRPSGTRSAGPERINHDKFARSSAMVQSPRRTASGPAHGRHHFGWPGGNRARCGAGARRPRGGGVQRHLPRLSAARTAPAARHRGAVRSTRSPAAPSCCCWRFPTPNSRHWSPAWRPPAPCGRAPSSCTPRAPTASPCSPR